MTVKINQVFSPPLPVHGGCPQGSLLSVMLFNISIDDVEQSASGILAELDEDDIHVG